MLAWDVLKDQAIFSRRLSGARVFWKKRRERSSRS
jgi:hypothetical protein